MAYDSLPTTNSTLDELAVLLKSFVKNTFDYLLVFVLLYAIYYFYKNNHEKLKSKSLSKWLINSLDLFTFGRSFDGTQYTLPFFKKRADTTAANLNASDSEHVKLNESINESTVRIDMKNEDASTSSKQKDNRENSLLSFFICFGGLQFSYLSWGLMQERIVKYGYGTDLNSAALKRFSNSQFLVLTNRFAGLALSSLILIYFNRRQQRTGGVTLPMSALIKKITSTNNWAPIFFCSFASMSNVLSSWCQYESLKYVSFTTQLLAKSSKSVFVMIVGRFVNGKHYKCSEYLSVFAIGFGVFLFSDVDDLESGKAMIVTTLPGLLCLLGYLISDSYTSNWQESLIKNYAMSSIALMFITNFYSSLFTFVSLVHQGQLGESIRFLYEHNGIMMHVVLLSATSAIGQIFIFVTIQKFGALVFSLIMTTRQVLSIILSSLIYQHSLSLQSVCGICLIFLALFSQQFLKLQRKESKRLVNL